MCGINGIVDFSKGGHYRDLVHEMNNTLSHRGPDDEGIWENEEVCLGHRRLSIIDLDKRSAQPMTSADERFTIVFNGEIYNFKQLKSELEGSYPFKTGGDTEVILAAFVKWGRACVEKLNGMFAFAVWDSENKTLFLCRDRMGIKPLYYHIEGGRIIFSSSLKSILSTGLVQKKIDRTALVDYIRFQTVHHPLTIVEGIYSLPAASHLTFHEDDHELQKYWDIRSFHAASTNQTFPQVAADLRERFRDAVSKRLVADVPFGAFLSGGVDSGVITAAMVELMDASSVNTFSIVFDNEKFTEQKFSRATAAKFGTNHHEIKVTPNDLLKNIEPAFQFMDHPSGDGPNTFLVSGAAKKEGITMALSGLGGDEVFGGYPIFDQIPYIRNKKWLMSFPLVARKLIGSSYDLIKGNNASEKMKHILRQDYFDTEYIYQFSRQVLMDKNVKRMLSDKSLPVNSVFEMLHREIAFDTPGFHLEPKAKISYAEMQTYLQHTLLRDTDQMSMAHALEVRVPFLDHELIEWLGTLPDSLRYHSRPKSLLIEAYKDVLPQEVYNRPKMGFVLPYEHWMKNELKSFCEQQLDYLMAMETVDQKGIQYLWERFINEDKKITWSRLWHLVALGYWLRHNGIKT